MAQKQNLTEMIRTKMMQQFSRRGITVDPSKFTEKDFVKFLLADEAKGAQRTYAMDKLVLEHEQSLEKASVKQVTSEALQEKAAQIKVDLAEQIPVAKAKGEVKAEQAKLELTQDPRLTEAKKTEARVSEMIRSGKIRSPQVLERTLFNLIPQNLGGAGETGVDPTRQQITSRLGNELSAKQTLTLYPTVRRFEKAGMDQHTALLQGRKHISEAGRGIPLPELVREGMEITEMKKSMLAKVTGMGMEMSRPQVGGKPEMLLTKPEGFFSKGAFEKASPGIAQGIELIEAGKVLPGKTMVETSLARMKNAPLKKAGLVAGLGGLLIPLLTKMASGPSQEVNPMQQIQMLQMLAQLQRDNQLSSSLASSREASAASDLAKADLLRLQALQMSGNRGLSVL